MAARKDFEDLIHPPSKQDFENFSEKKKNEKLFSLVLPTYRIQSNDRKLARFEK